VSDARLGGSSGPCPNVCLFCGGGSKIQPRACPVLMLDMVVGARQKGQGQPSATRGLSEVTRSEASCAQLGAADPCGVTSEHRIRAGTAELWSRRSLGVLEAAVVWDATAGSKTSRQTTSQK